MGLKAKRIVDAVLTRIANGFKNAAMVATELFPVVSVAKMGNIIPVYGKEAFKLYDTSRAPGAASNQMKLDPKSTIQAVLSEKDISIPIDVMESDESLFPEESDAAEVASDILDLGLEKEAADLATDTDNYAASNKVVLTDSFDEAAGDPIGVVETGKEAIRAQVGRKPNLLLLGASTFSILKNHSDLVGRIKYSMKGVLTKELMAEIFGVEKVVVGEAVYDNDGTMTDVWPDVAILAYVPKNAKSYRVPAAAYTLRKKSFKQIDKYFTEGGKVINVRATDVRVPKIVNAGAMYLITNTKA